MSFDRYLLGFTPNASAKSEDLLVHCLLLDPSLGVTDGAEKIGADFAGRRGEHGLDLLALGGGQWQARWAKTMWRPCRPPPIASAPRLRSDRWAVPLERRSRLGFVMAGLLCPGLALCGDGAALDLTGHWAGHAALGIFAVAYALVIAEETLHLRKSKPVMVAAGVFGPFGDITVWQKGVVCRSSSSWGRLRKQSMLRPKRALARCRALLVPCSQVSKRQRRNDGRR